MPAHLPMGKKNLDQVMTQFRRISLVLITSEQFTVITKHSHVEILILTGCVVLAICVALLMEKKNWGVLQTLCPQSLKKSSYIGLQIWTYKIGISKFYLQHSNSHQFSSTNSHFNKQCQSHKILVHKCHTLQEQYLSNKSINPIGINTKKAFLCLRLTTAHSWTKGSLRVMKV